LLIVINVIILACPDAFENNGMISLYNETDLSHLNTFIPSDDSFMMGSNFALISGQYYYLIIYNSISAIGNIGKINIQEVYVNRHAKENTESLTKYGEITDNDYVQFGKYFDIDSENVLYISSYGSQSTAPVHIIKTAQLWTHHQTYNVFLDSCANLMSGEFTYNIQSHTSMGCTNFDDKACNKRMVGENMWDFGWNVRKFGKYWESWSEYMNRVGEVLMDDYKWDDDDPYVWKQVKDKVEEPEDSMSELSKQLKS